MALTPWILVHKLAVNEVGLKNVFLGCVTSSSTLAMVFCPDADYDFLLVDFPASLSPLPVPEMQALTTCFSMGWSLRA